MGTLRLEQHLKTRGGSPIRPICTMHNDFYGTKMAAAGPPAAAAASVAAEVVEEVRGHPRHPANRSAGHLLGLLDVLLGLEGHAADQLRGVQLIRQAVTPLVAAVVVGRRDGLGAVELRQPGLRQRQHVGPWVSAVRMKWIYLNATSGVGERHALEQPSGPPLE